MMDDKEWLSSKVASIADEPLRAACERLLRDPRFFVSPAAAVKHQAHTGGLAKHTREVMDIALAMSRAETLNELARFDVIVAGTLWHDYGKIWDYKRNDQAVIDAYNRGFRPNGDTPPPEWVYARHRWTIRHLSRSYAEFHRVATECGVSEDLLEEVSHCILSHHGRKEWGSPVEPMSTEASMIHFADTIDALHVGKPHLFRDVDKNSDWKSGGLK